MFDQSPFVCRVEWGPRGAREASERGDIVIIVDVLSFSSTVVTAVEHGALIYPFPSPINEQAHKYAAALNAQMVWGRAEGLKFGGHSLSPLTFQPSDKGQSFVMCSLNGAACSWIASRVPALLIGCLLNATAVAKHADELSRKLDTPVTVIPCGEKWSDALSNENNMRPGIEDYLGAGAILSRLDGSKSPEAQVCIAAFEASRDRIKELIWDCGSGRELRERGFESDVEYCSQVDISSVVPILQENHFIDSSEL